MPDVLGNFGVRISSEEMDEMLEYFRTYRASNYWVEDAFPPEPEKPKKSKFSAFIQRVEGEEKAKAARSLKTALAEKGRFAYNKKPQDKVRMPWNG
jgi:hypothetical protein